MAFKQVGMASNDDLPPAKKMKRTSFSPWSSTSKGASKKDVAGPEPARIVSDISASSAEGLKASGLSSHPKIQSMQRDWERSRAKDGGSDSPVGSTGTETSVVSQVASVKQTRERRADSLGAQGTCVYFDHFQSFIPQLISVHLLTPQ